MRAKSSCTADDVLCCGSALYSHPVSLSSASLCITNPNGHPPHPCSSRGSRLIVLRGDPAAVVPNVLRQWGATDLCFEADFEPYSNTRDAAVTKEARAMGVRVHAPVSHTLVR